MSEDLHSSLTISLTDFETSDAIILYCSGISTISSNAWPFESSFFIVTYFFSEGFKLFFEFTNKFGGSDLPEKSSTYRAFILQKNDSDPWLSFSLHVRFFWSSVSNFRNFIISSFNRIIFSSPHIGNLYFSKMSQFLWVKFIFH